MFCPRCGELLEDFSEIEGGWCPRCEEWFPPDLIRDALKEEAEEEYAEEEAEDKMKIIVIYRAGVVGTYDVLREKASKIITHYLKNPNVIALVLVEKEATAQARKALEEAEG